MSEMRWNLPEPAEFSGLGVDPAVVVSRLVELAVAVERLGLGLHGESLVMHTGPHNVRDIVDIDELRSQYQHAAVERWAADRPRMPYAARIFHGAPGAILDHAAARSAIEQLRDILNTLPVELFER